jgi:hypothetical protein
LKASRDGNLDESRRSTGTGLLKILAAGILGGALKDLFD